MTILFSVSNVFYIINMSFLNISMHLHCKFKLGGEIEHIRY